MKTGKIILLFLIGALMYSCDPYGGDEDLPDMSPGYGEQLDEPEGGTLDDTVSDIGQTEELDYEAAEPGAEDAFGEAGGSEVAGNVADIGADQQREEFTESEEEPINGGMANEQYDEGFVGSVDEQAPVEGQAMQDEELMQEDEVVTGDAGIQAEEQPLEAGEETTMGVDEPAETAGNAGVAGSPGAELEEEVEGTAQVDQTEELTAPGDVGKVDVDSELVSQAQQALKDQGMDPGVVDGIMGPNTSQAIENFQRQAGLEVTGELDQQTLNALEISPQDTEFAE